MHTRERILTIRLLEKVQVNPSLADRFGLVIPNDRQTAPLLPVRIKEENK